MANVDIDEHTVITADMLAAAHIPKEGIHKSSARESSEVVGLVTTERILKGEQILTPKLKKIGENEGGLSYAIPENMRAVTVAVDEITGVAGFISPGDRVDILGVVTSGEASEQTSIMFLQNIEVVAVGKTLRSSTSLGKGDGEEDKKEDYSSVTLLLSPDDAVRLNLLTATGAMRMILRNPTDQNINNTVPRNSYNINS